jgi:hypothetical protein
MTALAVALCGRFSNRPFSHHLTLRAGSGGGTVGEWLASQIDEAGATTVRPWAAVHAEAAPGGLGSRAVLSRTSRVPAVATTDSANISMKARS